MSVLNKIVSYYPNKNATTQGIDTNLLTILQTIKHRDLLLNLRASPEEVQKHLKENLPCYTVAGRFSRRSKNGLIELSGLADVDLDSAGDCDIPYLLKELKKIENIAYAGLSCRGKRLHCIVPFLYPERYDEHYIALIRSFREYGLPMGDECHKQVSQPRFISLNDDSTQFFNHSAKPYSLLPVKKAYFHFKQNPKCVSVAAPDNSFQWCIDQVNKSNEFVTGKRHSYIIALARYCNIKGITEHETLIGCLAFAQDNFPKKEITSIVRHVYSTHSNSHNKIPFAEKETSEKSMTPGAKGRSERKLIEGSFLGTDGKFYIPNPVQNTRIAVYDNPDAYNRRLHIPTYVSMEEAEKFFRKSLHVDPITLQIIEL